MFYGDLLALTLKLYTNENRTMRNHENLNTKYYLFDKIKAFTKRTLAFYNTSAPYLSVLFQVE